MTVCYDQSRACSGFYRVSIDLGETKRQPLSTALSDAEIDWLTNRRTDLQPIADRPTRDFLIENILWIMSFVCNAKGRGKESTWWNNTCVIMFCKARVVENIHAAVHVRRNDADLYKSVGYHMNVLRDRMQTVLVKLCTVPACKSMKMQLRKLRTFHDLRFLGKGVCVAHMEQAGSGEKLVTIIKEILFTHIGAIKFRVTEVWNSQIKIMNATCNNT